MTVHHLADPQRVEAVPVLRLLEGLARVHPWILVIDDQRRVVWASEALAELPGVEALGPGTDARSFIAHLPRPEQVFPLRSNLRTRRHLGGAPLQVRGEGGRILDVDLDLVRIDAPTGELILAIAHQRVATSSATGGLDSALVDALPDPLLVLDGEGIVRRASRAACVLLGVPEDELLGRPATTLLGERVADVEALAAALAGSDGVSACEIRFRCQRETSRVLSIDLLPVGPGHRALRLRDVTDEQAVLGRLRKENEELEHSIGALAHDLRSPLVALLGFSRLLRQDYEAVLDDTGRHFVDRIEQAARTMEALIHDLLELARIGEPGERPAYVDPREVLLQLTAELKPRLDESGVELVLPSAPASRLYCDRSRLYQVFSNLIGNALEHMGSVAGARIEVAVDEDEQGHEITVSDNGRGIDPDHQGHIFEIFQSFGSRAKGRRGTGMGLAIVKKIAERYGGRVWVESEPGHGARFHVRLPRR